MSPPCLVPNMDIKNNGQNVEIDNDNMIWMAMMYVKCCSSFII